MASLGFRTLWTSAGLGGFALRYLATLMSPHRSMMALERCIAFLLADELDAEEFAHFKTPLQARGVRAATDDADADDDADDDADAVADDDDDDGDGDEGRKNYFSASVPSLSVLDFQKCFLLTQPQVEELVNLLSPCEWPTCKLEGWTVAHAVLASLWTLSTLEPHSNIAARFHTSESLVRLQLIDFCTLITENFADQIRWPKWKEAEASVAGFVTDVGLPGTVCVLGSCSIPIDRPADVPDPGVYRDSAENAYSLTLMAFCNHQGCFTFVNAEHPGNWHNSRVLLETEIGKALQEDPLNLLHGKHVIGDGTFPLSEHLLTPFPDYGMLGEKKLRYNLRVQAALRVVRGSLNSLRCRFQRLRCLQLNSVGQTSLAVKTCCILYNMYLETDNAASAGSVEEQASVQLPFHELPYGHSGSLGGISKRQDIAASLGRKTKKRYKGSWCETGWFEYFGNCLRFPHATEFGVYTKLDSLYRRKAVLMREIRGEGSDWVCADRKAQIITLYSRGEQKCKAAQKHDTEDWEKSRKAITFF